MSWAGNTSPVTVVSASEPTFQHDVETIERERSVPSLTLPLDANIDRYLDVSDENVVNRATQGIGYDPLPRPRVTAVSGGAWWGDTVSANGAYLDAIAANNLTFFYGRSARASSVNDLGNGFADQAMFTIPGDARSGFLQVLSNGHCSKASSATFVSLYPAGIDPYGSIRGVSWAPQTGRIWVGADGQVDEIELFKHLPVRTTRASGLTKVYISRVTATGELVFVDGVAGVAEVSVVDVTTGAVQQYALTTDSELTRSMVPVGIGVAYDGTACFIADASAGRLVKIPRGNGADITDGYGTYTGWSFPDPCNMDISNGGVLYVPDASAVLGVIPSDTYVDIWITGVRSVFMDREASTDGGNRYYMSREAGHAEVFNLNPIEYGSGPPYSESPARYLGGVVFALANGRLRLDPDWIYSFEHLSPQKVLLTNVRPEWPYQSPDQSIDHVIKLTVEGWEGVPLKLRLVDPPDLAPYDAKSLDDPTGYTEFPYHAEDNLCPSNDWGLSLHADGSDPHREITVMPDANYIATFYLKVPPDVSGNNFQVQAIKCDAATTTPIPERVVSISPVYTTWKRIYVERDRTFRRGGLLALDFPDTLCGAECSRVAVFEPLILQANDKIVLFDTSGAKEYAYVSSTAPGPGTSTYVYLKDAPDGGQPFVPQIQYDASSDQTNPSDPQMNFDEEFGKSAGIGVLHSADNMINDVSNNQINGSGSAFYEADLRDVERMFADSHVEFLCPRDGTQEVPYFYGLGFPKHWELSLLWFDNKNTDAYIHTMGANRRHDEPPGTATYGVTRREVNGTFPRASIIFVARAEETINPPAPGTQGVTDHELAHQFATNTLGAGEHCRSDNWLGTGPCIHHAGEEGGVNWDPGVHDNRLDADTSSTTSPNGGDLYDVRFSSESLPP